MACPLCDAIKENHRLITETKFSFAVICKWPLKYGHIMVLPKRHVTQDNFSGLTPEESKDFLSLLEKMQSLINGLGKENCLILKNSKYASTQDHLHFHLLPSKGGLRDLISSYENLSEREDISEGEYKKMRDSLISQL